jgi:hypothetical protein
MNFQLVGLIKLPHDEALNSCKEAIDHWITTAKEFGRDVQAPMGRRLQLD